MSIESLSLNRPAAEPARTRRAARPERRGETAPTERRFDAAEVRRGGSQPPRGTDTETMLSKLHERGLMTNISRPLGSDGEPIQTNEHGYGHAYGEVQSYGVEQTAETEIPEYAKNRIHEAVLRFGDRELQHAERPQENAPEGRVYGRPRPQPPRAPEEVGQSRGVFTIKLYSPKEDTGKTLRIGNHVIPLEADGSILAGMPDGTVRRITFDQDVMDEMVARGEVWMEGDEPETAEAAGSGRVEPQSDGAATDTERYSKGNPALVEQLKADLERRQSQMLDMVRDLLGKQGKAVYGDGLWRTLASGNFKVDAATKAQAQKNIAEDGFWGVEQTSDRIVQFAMGLAGSSPEMLDKMEAAFEKGYAAAQKKWGGALPEISQRTRARVHEKFEELRKQQKQGGGEVFATITASARTIEEETEG